MDIIEKVDKYMKDEFLNESLPLQYSGYHLDDNILDDITVEELQTTLVSNIPSDKLDERTAMKEFETILNMKIKDAKFIAKKVIKDMVKVLSKK